MKGLESLNREERIENLVLEFSHMKNEGDKITMHLFDKDEKEYAKAVVTKKSDEIRILQRPAMYLLVILQDDTPKEYISKGTAREVAGTTASFMENKRLETVEASAENEGPER